MNPTLSTFKCGFDAINSHIDNLDSPVIDSLLIGGVGIDCVDNVLKSTVTYYSSIYTYTCKPCSGAYTRIVESSVARSAEG